MADFAHEQAIGGRVAGVDEVGRGPLAGPVVAACVYFPEPARIPLGIKDSKALSAAKRAQLAQEIAAVAHVGIGMADVAEIDSINILQAVMLAMHRAVTAMGTEVDHILVDGNRLPKWPWPATALVKGDARSLSIAAASIIAKEHRDAYMCALDAQWPAYGWARNMGYGTAEHLAALARVGVCEHHRQSFAPVKKIISGGC